MEPTQQRFEITVTRTRGGKMWRTRLDHKGEIVYDSRLTHLLEEAMHEVTNRIELIMHEKD